MAKIQIYCILPDGSMLGLANCRENKGHDDSLPYQADIFFLKKENGKVTKSQIGSIWNDGWGGESDLEYNPNSSDIIKKVSELCGKHKMYYRGKAIAEYDIVSVCDVMAEAWCAILGDPGVKKALSTRKVSVLWKFDDEPDILARKDDRLPVFFGIEQY